MKDRIKQLMQKMQKEKVIVRAAAVAFAVAFLFGLYVFRGAIFLSSEEGVETENDDASNMVEPFTIRHPLTGEYIEEAVGLPQVFAVMIDDHYQAHPQSGVHKPFLVIEAPVEANIPRMEVFYFEGQEEIEKIGPVRSARPYFVDWANALDAMYVHVGGSPESLDLIATTDAFDFNQYWNGNYFWRSNKRGAPYNVYTSTELLQLGLENERDQERAPEEVLYRTWKFKDHAPEISEESIGLSVNYSLPTYKVTWTFDEETNQYQRSFGGRIERTLEGDRIWADNVVVLIVDITVIDSVGRRRLKTVGEGKAYVLQDGMKMEAVWKKKSVSERMRFFKKNGDEIYFNPGLTWIQVVGSEEILEFDEEI